MTTRLDSKPLPSLATLAIGLAALAFGCGPGAMPPASPQALTAEPLALQRETSRDLPTRSGPFSFPQDHGAHHETRTEWWYFTGHLRDAAGSPLGYELCFFRYGVIGYFFHVALTDELGQRFAFLRKYLLPGVAHVAADRADLEYGKSGVRQTEPFGFVLDGDFYDGRSFRLELSASRAPLVINGDGVIDMITGDSFYYSLTRLETAGSVTDASGTRSVTGTSWMDHQWGDFAVTPEGWDWFSFQMEDGSDYNLYAFRAGDDGAAPRYVNALDAGDVAHHDRSLDLDVASQWKSPHTGYVYGTAWDLTLPMTGERFDVEAALDDQELYATAVSDLAPTYWEGSVRVTKTLADGTKVKGLGYAEQFPLAARDQ